MDRAQFKFRVEDREDEDNELRLLVDDTRDLTEKTNKNTSSHHNNTTKTSNNNDVVDVNQKAIISITPRLRSLAMYLCRDVDQTEDLVQETILRALLYIDQFQPGTNLSAWLFKILRNLFFSEYRKRRREVQYDADLESYVDNVQAPEEDAAWLDSEEISVALSKLAPDHFQALVLVVCSELSYEEVAEICRCPVGTVKSRVNRARTQLSNLLQLDIVDFHMSKIRMREARRCLKRARAAR